MKERRFKQVDVFTRRPFRGNPVAVVLDAADLDAAAMQRIAAWTNLSETTFVLPASSAQADYRLRIFTPRAELPFAGHPTIGSAHAVLEAGVVTPKGGRLVQECGAGHIALQVEGDTLWLEAPEATESPIDGASLLQLEASLRAKPGGMPRILNVGPRWLVAELAGAAAVDALVPDMAAIAGLSVRLGIGGITVFGATDSGSAAYHVRSFAPAHGIPEDPVCGSGNISVAAYLGFTGRQSALATGYTARQGMQLGRDGEVSIRHVGGRILLGGGAVTCVDGALRS